MGRTTVDARVRVEAPLARVFDRITDHEAMRDWPGVSACRLIAEGTPRNGLGAVRRITAWGLTLDEEVVQFEPPRRYDYSIIKGLPVEHRGVVRLAEVDGAVEVDWHVELSSRVPLLAQAVGAALRFGLPRALRWFAQQTAHAAS
ncbi:MAG TPA: SRPBCC family protein [Polyangia bacterium]|nr:SRPBCC family protein [Polyangia bacterium]